MFETSETWKVNIYDDNPFVLRNLPSPLIAHVKERKQLYQMSETRTIFILMGLSEKNEMRLYLMTNQIHVSLIWLSSFRYLAHVQAWLFENRRTKGLHHLMFNFSCFGSFEHLNENVLLLCAKLWWSGIWCRAIEIRSNFLFLDSRSWVSKTTQPIWSVVVFRPFFECRTERHWVHIRGNHVRTQWRAHA